MRRSSVVTGGSVLTCRAWSRSGGSCGPPMSPTRGSCATSCGQTRTRTPWAGARMTGAWASPSGRRWSPSSSTNTTLTWYAERTRWGMVVCDLYTTPSIHDGLKQTETCYSISHLTRWWRMDMNSSPRGSLWRSSLLQTTVENLTTQVKNEGKQFTKASRCFTTSGAMMSVDETLMCSFQILKPADKKKFPYGGLNSGRPVTPPRGATVQKAKGKK